MAAFPELREGNSAVLRAMLAIGESRDVEESRTMSRTGMN